jgi:hypothetical protein
MSVKTVFSAQDLSETTPQFRELMAFSHFSAQFRGTVIASVAWQRVKVMKI